MSGRTLQHIEAHALINEDRGVPIVATSLAITYVGWFQAITEGPDGWVTVLIEDFTGLRCSVLLRSRAHVHIEPFETLNVGDLVVRKGFDDPDHKNYRRPDLGHVEQVSRSPKIRAKVYLVRWEGERDARWYTRRMLQPATESTVALLREMERAR